MSKAKVGEWSNTFPLANVAAHASLLPDGQRILYWGRRKDPKSTDPKTMAEADNTDTFILDLTKNSLPTNKDSKQTFGPGVLDKANLFCSGHCWLSDGRLIVFGGHIKDGWGSNQACIFNPKGGDKKQVFRHRNLDLSTFPFPSLDLSVALSLAAST